MSKGLLSDWFSRDEAVPLVPLKKKPNPRNVANTAKAEELERELERYICTSFSKFVHLADPAPRLKAQRAEWEQLMKSAIPPSSPVPETDDGSLSPLHPELLDSPQRAVLEQLQAPTTATSTEPEAIQQRLRDISDNLEFSVDQFADGVHVLSTSRDVAERLADRSLSDAAKMLEDRERDRVADGKSIDAMDALKGLARVLNGQSR